MQISLTFMCPLQTRLLPARLAGESDRQLEHDHAHERPLPARLAGEEDLRLPSAHDLIHLPGKPAGVFYLGRDGLAIDPIHLPDELAGVWKALDGNGSEAGYL
jgi:hypothetical protein